MATDLTAADWAAMRGRCEAATPGPWRYIEADNVTVAESETATKPFATIGFVYPQFVGTDVGIEARRANAEFSAHARTDLPLALDARDAALDALARQQEANARLTAMLAECYRLSGADPDGNEDWRLAEDVVDAVRELRESHDAEQAINVKAIAASCDESRRTRLVKAEAALADRDATIARLQEAQAWQPIETAPKDGRCVLLWWPFWCPTRPVVGSFGYKGIQQWMAAESLEGDGDPPTHWMPLPLTTAKEADRE